MTDKAPSHRGTRTQSGSPVIPEQRRLDVSLTQARVDAIFQALAEQRGRRRPNPKAQPQQRKPGSHA